MRGAATAARSVAAAPAADPSVGRRRPRERRSPARSGTRRPRPRPQRCKQQWRRGTRRSYLSRRRGAGAAAVAARQPSPPVVRRPPGLLGARGGAPPGQAGSDRTGAPLRNCRHCLCRSGHCRIHEGCGRSHGYVSAPPPWRRRSRATAMADAGRRAPPRPPAVVRRRAAYGGTAAGLAPPSRLCGARSGLGHSRPCPSIPVVVAPAFGCAPSTLRVCARGDGLWRLTRRPAPPQRRHPLELPGSGDGYAVAAPPAAGAGTPLRAHPEQPSGPRCCACARGRGGSGASPPPRTRGCDANGVSMAQRAWERVETGWGGGGTPPRSRLWSAVHSLGLRGGYCASAMVRGSCAGRLVVSAHPTTSSPSPNVYTCQKRVSQMLHVALFRLLGLGTAPQQRRAPQIEERKLEST